MVMDYKERIKKIDELRRELLRRKPWLSEIREKSVVRIIDVPGGYALSDDQLDYIDTSGPVYRTVRLAYAAAREKGYTHVIPLRGRVRRIGERRLRSSGLSEDRRGRSLQESASREAIALAQKIVDPTGMDLRWDNEMRARGWRDSKDVIEANRKFDKLVDSMIKDLAELIDWDKLRRDMAGHR